MSLCSLPKPSCQTLLVLLLIVLAGWSIYNALRFMSHSSTAATGGNEMMSARFPAADLPADLPVSKNNQTTTISSSANHHPDDDSNSDKVPRQQHHKLFIMVGAVRTLNRTAESILRHVIHRTCPPSDGCIAHLVTHLSNADNRPDKQGNDPLGQVVVVPMEGNAKNQLELPLLQPSPYLHIHPVQSAYDTGSPQEQAAMDVVQAELERNNNHAMIAQRMKLWRVGDPRRWSMWFARYWAWRFVQQTLLHDYQFELIAFLRPDLFWFLPAPTADLFVVPSDTKKKKAKDPAPLDVWVHDSYYSYDKIQSYLLYTIKESLL